MKKQTPDLRVMTQRNKSVEEDSADKNGRSGSEEVHRENATCSNERTIVKLPVIASFAGTTKKIVMVKHPAHPHKPSYCRSNFHVNSSPISLETTKGVTKVQDTVHMLQMDPQNLKKDKTEETDTAIKDGGGFSCTGTDTNTSKNISRKGRITAESCKKRSRVISKANQQDLDFDSGRVLRQGSKQPSVRSARERLEEARDVTGPDTPKIYKNFQQSKPEEPTSTPALPMKVVARSVDEIIASLRSASPSPSDQTIKALLEGVLGQNYNIKMEKESQAAENESWPKDELLTHDKQVKQALSLDVLQVEGKAISKIKPDEVQKELQEEHDLQQSLPPQASNVKGQDYPGIHHLCTAFPGFILPPYLQLVSRIYHTFDKRGHNILLTAEDMDNKEEGPTCSKYINLKVQAEKKKICYEGVPISEQFQNNRTDGIHFLPPHTSKSLIECQKVTEYCLKKPQLQLLGEKVSIYPEALKKFWGPAPPKFSAPISSLKEILFPTYESSTIEDIVSEDFFTDYKEEEEELEVEQDVHDFRDYRLTKSLLRRCQSLPDFPDSESSETGFIKRSVSALEITAFKDEIMLNLSANFKTSMKELEVMKQWMAELEAEREIGKSSPTKHLFNDICDDPQSMQTDIPVEKMTTLSGQEDSENDIVLVERLQKAGIKCTVSPRRKKTKKSKKIINPRKLEAVIKKLSQPPKILTRFSSINVYCFLKNVF